MIYEQKHMKYLKSLTVLLLLILTTLSCGVRRTHRSSDLSQYSQLYRELSSTDTSNISDIPWNKLFTDPLLQSLIEKTITHNPDLQIAIARVKKAEANFRQSRAEYFPSLNAGLNASFQNLNEQGQGIPESYQIFGTTSWEADLWGKLRSSKRAALASLLASEAYKRAVLTQLIASVAINYYTLAALDAQLEIAQSTVEKRIKNVEVMEIMKENDVITGADLVLSQANRYSAEVLIPDLKQRIYETENILSVLMGQNPGPIERSKLEDQELSADLKTGVPAQLLANRPDVQEAEYRLRYFFELKNVARRYFYPSLTISARSGITETSLQQLFSAPFLFWNVTGGLTQPIFNYGLNRQRLKVAEADFEESQALFKRTLLTAGEEVVSALHGYQTATEKITLRSRQIEYLEKSVEFTMELLKYTSSTNYIDVLTSEVNLLQAQLNIVNDKLDQLQSIVLLYQSLGGGWKY
jgi:NodT family efflux transporter outer membrane factor (OMF) lipoprotein